MTISAGLQASNVLTINKSDLWIGNKNENLLQFEGGKNQYDNCCNANRTLTYQVSDGESLSNLSNTMDRTVSVA